MRDVDATWYTMSAGAEVNVSVESLGVTMS
jgi:hypothetical protein